MPGLDINIQVSGCGRLGWDHQCMGPQVKNHQKILQGNHHEKVLMFTQDHRGQSCYTDSQSSYIFLTKLYVLCTTCMYQ